jgi:ketosteroid isomerase-like protein
MNSPTHEVTAEAAVREALEAWADAVRERNLPVILSHYADDIVAFDAVGALRFVGKTAYARHWESCMALCPGQMIFELREVQVTAVADLALCAYLCRCGYSDGKQEQSGWMRGTAGVRRYPEGWRIVHKHSSAPFDPQSGRALFDLVPSRSSKGGSP